jgi:hypothetical protein
MASSLLFKRMMVQALSVCVSPLAEFGRRTFRHAAIYRRSSIRVRISKRAAHGKTCSGHRGRHASFRQTVEQ